MTPVAGDLLDPASLATALAGLDPSHVFISTWLRQNTEAENIRVNAAMVRNLLDAGWFGIDAVPFDGVVRPLEQQMAGDAAVWRDIATRHGLAEPDIDRLISPWHTDADLGCPIEVVTDMSKSRRLGFLLYQPTDDAFYALFDQLRKDRLIP